MSDACSARYSSNLGWHTCHPGLYPGNGLHKSLPGNLKGMFNLPFDLTRKAERHHYKCPFGAMLIVIAQVPSYHGSNERSEIFKMLLNNLPNLFCINLIIDVYHPITESRHSLKRRFHVCWYQLNCNFCRIFFSSIISKTPLAARHQNHDTRPANRAQSHSRNE